jgi:hypothetical protein
MLTSFSIKNFRLFDKLEISRLGRINLVVGRNNSGKSALLEGIEIYCSNAQPHVLADLVTARQEGWTGQSQLNGEAAGLNPIRHLFLNHHLPSLGHEGIAVGPLEPTSEQLKIDLAAYRVEIGDDPGERFFALVEPDEKLEDPSEIDLALVVREGERVRRLFWLGRDFEKEANRSRRSTVLSPPSPKYPAVVVPTRNMTDERLATLWDQISLTGLDQEVVTGLQLLEPAITGIAFVEGAGRIRPNRLPLVKTGNTSEPLPLKSMGDGMMRLFHIIVALVNARNGLLLIDEFENGLHWSVQPKIWQTVFRLAQRLDVQVFATTHSRDCVVGYESAWREAEDQGAFFRLNVKSGGGVFATSYSCETLSDALETDVEIR